VTTLDNAGPLLETKLHVPRLRRGLVARPRLIERMNRGAESKLTLISAPPDFGKTTLLVAWLSADAALPLARLRARGELVEIRAADLRFTPGEAAAFSGDDRSIGRRPAGTLQGPSQRSDSGGELGPWSIRG
jgi:ATP/maltotriose-dependent transcriptional regulator MalT